MSEQPNVSQEVARLFVPQALNPFFPSQPIATFKWICKALKLFTQGQAAMLTQVVSRNYDIARSLNRKPVSPVRLQGQCHIFALAVDYKRSDRFDGTEPHARRRAGS